MTLNEKKMVCPASHFMITSSEFATIHSLYPNQPTLLTRVGLKETLNIHTKFPCTWLKIGLLKSDSTELGAESSSGRMLFFTLLFY